MTDNDLWEKAREIKKEAKEEIKKQVESGLTVVKIEDRDMKPEYDQEEVKKAFDVIKAAMVADDPSEKGSLAHAWHCNIAMACSDAFHAADIVDECCLDEMHATCNDAASRFMKLCFDVETKG
jgi:hypothetical protein